MSVASIVEQISIMTPLVTVKDYLSMIERGEVLLDAGFQRGIVWDKAKRRQYILGVAKGTGKLSVIVLGKVGDKPYLIVDGMNRTISLLQAVKGELDVDGVSREQLLNAQLLVSMVSARDMRQIVDLFRMLNMNQVRMKLGDVVFAYRVIDGRYQIIYDFAQQLRKRVKLPPRSDYLIYAFAAIYYAISKSAVPYKRIAKKLPYIERWSKEEIISAINALNNIELPPKPDELPLKILTELHGVSREAVERALMKRTALSPVMERDPYAVVEKLVEEALASCKTKTCSIKASALVNAAKLADEEAARLARRVLKTAVAYGICETRRGRYICDKEALLKHVKERNILSVF